MTRRFAFALPMFLSCLCLPVAAAAANETIVVTGKDVRDRAAVEHRATAFVRAATANGTSGQYARRTSICPKVFGLPNPKYAAIVLDKIGEAALAAGLPAPKPRCDGDLAVVFTDNGDALMKRLLKRSPRVFSRITSTKDRELFESGRAVRWWYATSVSGSDRGSKAEAGEIRDGQGVFAADTLSVWTSSLIETNISVQLQGTVVVIDVNKASGFPLDSLASYAAMVSLAQINGKDRFGDAPSILSIMESGDRAQVRHDLSDWDRAFLKTLYALPTNREAWTQRGALVGAIVKSEMP